MSWAEFPGIDLYNNRYVARSRSVNSTRSMSSIRTNRSSHHAEDSQLVHGSNTTYTTWNRSGGRKQAFIKDISAINHLRLTDYGRVSTVSGQQGILSIGNSPGVTTNYGIYSVSDLNAIKGYITATTATQFCVPYGKVEYMFTNSSTGNTIMYLYDVVPKKDINTTDTAYQIPDYAWAQGYNQEGGTTTDYAVVGATPFESKLFTETWTVIAVKKVIMAPGAMHRHIVKSHQHKFFSDSQWNNLFSAGSFTNTVQYLRKSSIITMVVVYGGPVHSAAAPTTTSTGPAAVDWIALKEYDYRWASDFNTTYNKSNNLTTVNDPQEVPEATQAFTNVTIA